MPDHDNRELRERLIEDPATAKLLLRWRQSIIEVEAAESCHFGDEIEKPSDVGDTNPERPSP